MWAGVAFLPVAETTGLEGDVDICQGLSRVYAGAKRGMAKQIIAQAGERDTRHQVVFNRLLTLIFSGFCI